VWLQVPSEPGAVPHDCQKNSHTLIVYTGIHLSSLAIGYFTTKDKIYWEKNEIVVCVLMPLSQIIRPLAYMFYLNSIKKFGWGAAKAKAGEWKQSWIFCCLHFRNWLLRKNNAVMLKTLMLVNISHLPS